MSVFRRRRQEAGDGPVGDEQADDGLDVASEPDEAALAADALAEQEAAEQDRAERLRQEREQGGPWDASEEPEDELTRVDLGGLRVPVPADTEVRVDMNQAGEVFAATLVQGESKVQVNAFAAPRSEGLWHEVREEIATALRSGGGSVQEAEGPFGPELVAQVPTDAGGQGPRLVPARFVGVDGPRWFLRALLTGPAAVDRTVAAPLEAALRQVVVVRGADPMAVRDPLALRLPPDAQVAPAPSAAATAPATAAPQLPERGPEITETR